MNSAESISQALIIKRREMTLTGLLNWQNIQFKDFRVLGSQKHLRVLDISNSKVTSLHTLQAQPIMNEIIANGSQLNTFAGLSSQPRLAKISFLNTPLAEIKNSRMAAIIVIGPRVSVVNGVPVTQKERRIALSYPPVTKYLLEAGWVLQMPPPSICDFHYLVDQFGLTVKDEDMIAASEPLRMQSQDNDESGMMYSGEASDLSLAQRLGDILRPLGFPITSGDDAEASVVHAVASIVDVLCRLDDQQNSQVFE